MNYKLFLPWLGISLSLILPPLLLGGVYSHLEPNFIIIFITSLVSFVYFLYLLIFKKTVVISTILIPLGCIFLYSLIQLIPLPAGILKVLSPKGYYFQAIESVSSRPLTMSIPDTFYSSLRVVTLMLFAVMTARAVFAGSKRIRQMILDTVIYTSTVVIFISAAVGLLQLEKWFYGTLRHPGFLIEPIIVNPNHAAAYFGISGILALTLALSNDFKRIQILYGVLFFIHTIAVAATVSRGGILAYFVSIVFMLFLQKNEEGRSLRKRIFIVISVVFALTIVFYSGYSLIEKAFDVSRPEYFDKIDNIKTVKNYFSDFYLTGSGLGSFSKVYPYYQQNPEKHFEQLENEPVQFALETGVFFSVFVILMFFMVILKGAGTGKPEKRNGLLSIIFFILIQNTVDFNLHNFSILFPVTLVIIFIAKPVSVSKISRILLLTTALIFSLAVMITVSTDYGRKLCGYESKADYASKVYLYPADYTVPMNEALKNINSRNKAEIAGSGQFISSAIMKAPYYYFVYYLAGNYMSRIGSGQAVEFYEKSIKLSDPGNLDLLRKIYSDLVHQKKENEIIRMLRVVPEGPNEIVEPFLFEISKTNEHVVEFIMENKLKYFVAALKIYMSKKEYEKAEKLISYVENNRSDLSLKQKGKLFMNKGYLHAINGSFDLAFKDYLKGSALTDDFYDYLLLANCSLNLENKDMELADGKLKKFNLLSVNTMTDYYRWLSKKEFKENNFAKGIKTLEKAAELSKRPGIFFDIAKIYSRQELHTKALENIVKLKKLYPDFNKKEVDAFFKDEQKKLSDSEYKLFKESILKQGH